MRSPSRKPKLSRPKTTSGQLSGSLCVMKKGPDGNCVMTPGGGVDQNYLVDSIYISNDGGDW